MLPKDAVASCPYDGCPLRPFKTVKAPFGYRIALHGCRYCDFNFVVAVAHDEGDALEIRREVAQWSVDPASGSYVLVKEYGRNPPGWLELVCSALPERKPL